MKLTLKNIIGYDDLDQDLKFKLFYIEQEQGKWRKERMNT